ncbi:hypothetical protein SteCoe_8044 [Stentor coeruleus]|uniref:non-specific serine/threonine protein kinase n=1 Tax=Stentor coeruleus TaxID=5963 RepID=A0A1R2CL79_9CILI|nr:hypothetical protein SteCoe_8044 [Stentor coeruleus]
MGCTYGKKAKALHDKCIEIHKPFKNNEKNEIKAGSGIVNTIKNQSWVEDKGQYIQSSQVAKTKIPEIPLQTIKFESSLFAHFNNKSLYTDYELAGKIGEGFYGHVRLANHRKTRTQRAVKSIEKSKMSFTQIERNNFLNEFEILKQANHTNIVKTFDCYEDRTNFHIVMEYISEGKLLDYWAKVKPFSEATAAYFMQQILSAIAYCHEKGIIHGDLQPDNILLDSFTDKSIVKIVGFGNSILNGYVSFSNSQSSSVQFKAPEVLKKQKFCEKCDIWSCGIILYILLSGIVPFPGRTQEIIKKRILAGNISFKGPEWASISIQAKSLISQMLTYNDSTRITAQKALNSPWIQQNLKNLNLVSNLNTGSLTKISSQFKQAILMFIVSFALSKYCIRELTLILKKLDKNRDGKLSIEELKEAYNKVNKNRRAKDFEDIINAIDKDKIGFIKYKDFIAVCLKQDEIDNEVYLEIAFKTFDTGRTGKISIEKLGKAIGIEYDKKGDQKKMLMNNEDEEIDFGRFKKMIIKGIS